MIECEGVNGEAVSRSEKQIMGERKEHGKISLVGEAGVLEAGKARHLHGAALEYKLTASAQHYRRMVISE